MNTPPTSSQLTKPADWAIHLVSACLCPTADTALSTDFDTADAVKIAFYDCLNWHEAHQSYSWPDFVSMGFDFAQSMRLRRALVMDAFIALLKNGNLSVGDASGAGVAGNGGLQATVERGVKCVVSAGNNGPAKRRCPSSTSTRRPHAHFSGHDTEPDEPFWNDTTFLADTMHELVSRTDADIDGYLKSEKTTEALADIVRDGLVEAWDRPRAGYCYVPGELIRREKAWAKASKMAARETSPELGEPVKRNGVKKTTPELQPKVKKEIQTAAHRETTAEFDERIRKLPAVLYADKKARRLEGL
ncbi:hypothetical protein K458DRAFT_390481 [Lentithecium fluviatile CBS 122367]|uniref:Uncharacterized protein n=1 Tax=Lentithecium fluviatile CBS 122367 TaxID=1168545 RepID=A0A6G1IY91_9PLEO|nr:hypothetical protein K458DRAFT_390481 [Lentithecium fluviatile CBS 122367]